LQREGNAARLAEQGHRVTPREPLRGKLQSGVRRHKPATDSR
jgi:hypothetical protein